MYSILTRKHIVFIIIKNIIDNKKIIPMPNEQRAASLDNKITLKYIKINKFNP